MRRVITTCLAALAATAVAASADMTTETTTTTYRGTVSSVSPSTIVMTPESAQAPQQYTYTEKTTWVDPAGNTVSRDAVQNTPVTIYTERQGDQIVVTKVVTQKTVSAPATGGQQTITTTTTTTPVD